MTDKLKVLDLFSGIGGFSLGLERTGGFETVAFCEIEEFPRKVLNKHWPDVPCFEDVRKLGRNDVDETIDVICGGYPCQPFSTAGKRKGEEDDRHLWPEVNRLVDEFRPDWFIGENVAGHISMGLDAVLSDLEAKRYTSRTFIIPACGVGAFHKRDRVWIIAYANDVLHEGRLADRKSAGPAEGNKKSNKFKTGPKDGKRIRAEFGTSSEALADTMRKRPQGWAGDSMEFRQQQVSSGKRDISLGRHREWEPEPNVGRVANGVPNRVDRLKALGNAVVPQIPEIIGHAILEAQNG